MLLEKLLKRNLMWIIKQFHAHIAHNCEKIAEKSNNLAIEPVHEIPHDRIHYEIENKDLSSPPNIFALR